MLQSNNLLVARLLRDGVNIACGSWLYSIALIWHGVAATPEPYSNSLLLLGSGFNDNDDKNEMEYSVIEIQEKTELAFRGFSVGYALKLTKFSGIVYTPTNSPRSWISSSESWKWLTVVSSDILSELLTDNNTGLELVTVNVVSWLAKNTQSNDLDVSKIMAIFFDGLSILLPQIMHLLDQTHLSRWSHLSKSDNSLVNLTMYTSAQHPRFMDKEANI